MIAYLSFQSLLDRTSAANDVTHTLQVTEAVQGLLSTMSGAEAGARGYLLTGNEEYLALYTTARAQVAGELVNLRRLTSGNYAQQQRIDALGQLTTAQIDVMAQAVTLRRSGNTEGAIAV
ncbi:MAG TPA: CHASE3 domain-containing protein, partial [Rhodanobacter sp.]